MTMPPFHRILATAAICLAAMEITHKKTTYVVKTKETELTIQLFFISSLLLFFCLVLPKCAGPIFMILVFE